MLTRQKLKHDETTRELFKSHAELGVIETQVAFLGRLIPRGHKIAAVYPGITPS